MYVKMTDEKKLDFYLALYSNCKEEFRQRIKQRDSFTLQWLLAFCTILVTFCEVPTYGLFIYLTLPAFTLFYTINILESYRYSDDITNYIKIKLIPKIKKLVNEDHYIFYEKSSLIISQTRKKIFTFINFFMPLLIIIVSIFCVRASGDDLPTFLKTNQRKQIFIIVVCIYALIIEIVNIIFMYLYKNKIKKYKLSISLDININCP